MNTHYTCGIPLPSGCVVYTGALPAFISEESLGDCAPRLNEIFERYNQTVDELLAHVNLKALNKGCYNLNPATAKVGDFAQETIDKVCALSTAVFNLQTTFTNLDISQEVFDIDLKCLAPSAAPCLQGTSAYTLKAVLNVLIAEICAIKSQLNP